MKPGDSKSRILSARMPGWKQWTARFLLLPGMAGVGLYAWSHLSTAQEKPTQSGEPPAIEAIPPVTDVDKALDQARLHMIRAQSAYDARNYTRAKTEALRAAQLNAKFTDTEATPQDLLRKIGDRLGQPVAMPSLSTPTPALPSVDAVMPSAAPALEPIKAVEPVPPVAPMALPTPMVPSVIPPLPSAVEPSVVIPPVVDTPKPMPTAPAVDLPLLMLPAVDLPKPMAAAVDLPMPMMPAVDLPKPMDEVFKPVETPVAVAPVAEGTVEVMPVPLSPMPTGTSPSPLPTMPTQERVNTTKPKPAVDEPVAKPFMKMKATGNPSQLLKQGREALDAGKLDQAQELGRQAEELKPSTRWGFFDDTPVALMADVQKARSKRDRAEADSLMKEARRLFQKPTTSDEDRLKSMDEAQTMAFKAERLHGPYSVWDMGDRPGKLVTEIENTRQKTRNAMARKAVTDPARVAKADGTTPAAPSLPVAMEPIPRTDAVPQADVELKKQARDLLAEADALLAKGDYVRAKSRLMAAQKLNAAFGTDEETPDAKLAKLHGDALNEMTAKCNQAAELSIKGDKASFDAANKLLDEAQATADGLALDANSVKEHRMALKGMIAQASRELPKVATRPQPTAMPTPMPTPPMVAIADKPPIEVAPIVVAPAENPAPVAIAPTPVEMTPTPVVMTPKPANPAMPTPTNQGVELLSKARLELRNGETEAARRLTLEALSGGHGVDREASALMRTIGAEEENQRRRVAEKSYESGLALYQQKRYRQALAVFQLIDPMTLPAEKRPAMRDLMVQAGNESRKAEALANGSDITRTKAVDDGTPGVKTAADKGAQTADKGGADSLLKQQEALQEVQFQQLRVEGLKLQKEATERFTRGETDEAVESLRAFVARVKAANLDSSKTTLLTRTVESRLAEFDLLKHNQDVKTAQSGSSQKFKADQNQQTLAAEHKKEEVGKLMKQYHALIQDHKFREAERVAMIAGELSPDDPVVRSAMQIARTRYRQETWDGIKSRKETMVWDGINEANEPGPSVNSAKPLSVDPDILRQNLTTRQDYSQGRASRRVMSEREYQIESSLKTKTIDLNFRQTPLADVIDDIRKRTGMNIDVAQEVAEENINMRQPITIALTDLPLRHALKAVLMRAKLTYVVEDDVLKITTEKGARGKLKLVTIPVTDLVIAVEDNLPSKTSSLDAMLAHHVDTNKAMIQGTGVFTPSLGLNPGTGAAVGSPSNGSSGGNRLTSTSPSTTIASSKGTKEDVLIRLITNTIYPASWSSAGGSGQIEYNPTVMALVINQTPDVIEQVTELLESLRRLQDVEVSIEVRLITLAETFYERIGVDFGVNIKTNTTRFEPNITTSSYRPSPYVNDNNLKGAVIGLTPANTFTSDLDIPIRATSFQYAIPAFGGFPNTPGANGGISLGLAFLNDIQVNLFMEAAQGDRRTNVMQAPKLTMFNGQSGTISINDQQFFVTGVSVLAVNGQIVFTPQNNPFPLGVQMTLQPAVSGDRRFVRINVNLQLSNLASATVPLFPVTTIVNSVFDGGFQAQSQPFTQYIQQPAFTTTTVQTTVAVPDGGTVILGGLKTMSEGRNEFGPPVLSKIPYVNRLFKNVGYGREAQSLLMMITPRIIINREEEFKQTGVVPSDIDQGAGNNQVGAPAR